MFDIRCHPIQNKARELQFRPTARIGIPISNRFGGFVDFLGFGFIDLSAGIIKMLNCKLPFLVTVCIALFVTQTAHAQIIAFGLEGQAGVGLLPGNEIGDVTSPGTGGVLTSILFDVGTSELSIDVGWGSGNGFTDLTGPAVAMHIHGPADFFSNAGVLYPLDGLSGFNGSASNGGLNDSVTIAPGDVSNLLNGLFYINVHTAANGGGELRGNLVQVPEPSGLLILGLAGTTVLMRRRKR